MAETSGSESKEHGHGQLRSVITQSILADVIHGRLHSGQRLVTRALAERFGTSHTPVREALTTLEGIGVVDLQPNRGAVVRSLGERDVREILEVRRALECLAVKAACGRISDDELEQLLSEINRVVIDRPTPTETTLERARVLDSRLHDLIAENCGNAFLQMELNRLRVLFRAFRDVVFEYLEAQKNFDRIKNEAREHVAIIESLQQGNRKQASKAMSRHMRNSTRYWCEALADMERVN